VGWGFVMSANGHDATVLATYTGHATSTTTNNHVVLYTVNNCSNTTDGLLEEVDLEKSSDILREFIKQGWLKE
jgi:ribonuclease HI